MSWIILSIGIFAVIVISLGLTRSQQMRESSRMSEELSVAEMRLEQVQIKDLTEQQKETQQELDTIKAQLLMVENRMGQSIESIDVTDKFYAIAKSCDTTVLIYNSSKVKGESVEGLACNAITLNARVAGNVSNLINLVFKLNGDFTTGVVNTAQITVPSQEGEPELNVNMVVYTYKGD
jgi:hypothetical protein